MSDRQHDHGDDSGGDASDGMDHSSMGGMAMSFHTGSKETILFEPWETNSVGKFVASCIGIFLLAVAYEALKYFRESMYVTEASPLLDNGSVSLVGGIRRNILKSRHLVQTLLHMIQLVISYFLMLIFMTYNVWLAVAITLGAGVGYLLFGWNKRSATDVTEHCH